MVRFWLALAAGALAIPLLPFAILGDLPGPEWLEGHPTYTFVVGVFLLGSDILLPIPSSLVAVALGAKLGPWPGALAVFLGLSSAALIGYLLGWHIGYRAVSAFASPGSCGQWMNSSAAVLTSCWHCAARCQCSPKRP